jgi:hypothetical protein
MSGGISRVHGGIKPGSLAGVSLADFNVTFWLGDAANLATDYNSGNGSVPDGALDKVFRTAIETVATVSRVGQLKTNVMNFTIETLGTDGLDGNGSFLGTGPTDANSSTTALALQGAIRSLGVLNYWANSGTASASYLRVDCSTATIASGVAANTTGF